MALVVTLDVNIPPDIDPAQVAEIIRKAVDQVTDSEVSTQLIISDDTNISQRMQISIAQEDSRRLKSIFRK